MADVQALQTTPLRALHLARPPMLPAETPLGDAIATLRQSDTACILITDGDDLKGIFTERDYLTRVVQQQLAPETTIGQIMTPDPLLLEDSQPLYRALELMATRTVRHLPITRKGKVRGVIYGKDLIEFIAEQYPSAVVNLPPRSDLTMKRAEGG